MYARHFLAGAAVFLFVSTQAQEESLPGNYENGTNLNVLYRNEMSGKLFATTRGFGVMFRQGKHVTSRTRSFYDIDLQTLRHPKEMKLAGEAENRKQIGRASCRERV